MIGCKDQRFGGMSRLVIICFVYWCLMVFLSCHIMCHIAEGVSVLRQTITVYIMNNKKAINEFYVIDKVEHLKISTKFYQVKPWMI